MPYFRAIASKRAPGRVGRAASGPQMANSAAPGVPPHGSRSEALILKYTSKMRIRNLGDGLVETPRPSRAPCLLVFKSAFRDLVVVKVRCYSGFSSLGTLSALWAMEFFQDWADAMRDKSKTSSNTTTTTMTTPAKLYGKDLGAYDEIDVEDLLAKLSPEEINILAKEVDPDDSFLPPSQRCNYDCEKESTGPLNRKQLIEHINKQAIETPDVVEAKPYVAGVVRGKKWIPPEPPKKEKDADEQIAIDLGDEYESALQDASQEEIIDLAAILGFHSMMNQDQYHASLLNKGQPVGVGWDGITKASKQKIYPQDPPNNTNPDETLKQVKEDSSKLVDLNWNNIKNISDDKFDSLFEALANNTHLETLSLTNVGLTDKQAHNLADALEKNNTLKVVNVETNFISPTGVVRLMKSLLKTKTVEEFRATNQRSQVLGNKIEMEITSLVEQNPTLLRLGLHLEYNDARHRIATHLQRNIDTIRKDLTLRLQFRFFNHRKTPLIN